MGADRAVAKLAIVAGVLSAVGALGSLGSPVAWADDRDRVVSFRADRADVDAERIVLCRARLSLPSRGWTLSAERIELRAGRLSARGRVIVRPCAGRGTSALLAERLDLREPSVRLEAVRLRLFGVTSPSIPWVELVAASSERVGLLPPELGWRRDTGATFGLGVYVPLGRDLGLEPRARIGSHGSGGELRVVSDGIEAHAEMAVRHEGGVSGVLDANGAARAQPVAIAVDARVARGARDWLSPSSDVRLRHVDDAAATAAIATDHFVVASAVETWRDATNAAARWSAAAPRVALGARTALGPWSIGAGFDVDAVLGESAWTRSFAETEIAGSLGPLKLASIARAELRDPSADDAGHAVTTAGSAAVSLRRRFGHRWVHRVTPRIGVSGAWLVRERVTSMGRAVEPLPRDDGAIAMVALGTSLARDGIRVAEIDVAARVPFVDRPEAPSLHARARTRFRALSTDAAAAWVTTRGASIEPAIVSVSWSIELGARFGATLGLLHTTARASLVTLTQPFEPLVQGPVPLASRGATLVGGSLRSPWLGPVSLSAGGDLDAGRSVIARIVGGLAVRDGCVVLLATGAWLRDDDAPELRLALELTR